MLVLAVIAVPWFGSVWSSSARVSSTGFLFAVSALTAILIVLYRAAVLLRSPASLGAPVGVCAHPVDGAHNHCFDGHRPLMLML